jgi:CRP-like cAMP-binding protein
MLSGAAANAIANFTLKKMSSTIQAPPKKNTDDKESSPIGFII